MKKIIGIFAVVALAACGGTDEDTVILEDPTIEQPAPIVTEPMPPMTTDTLLMTDTLTVDTAVTP